MGVRMAKHIASDEEEDEDEDVHTSVGEREQRQQETGPSNISQVHEAENGSVGPHFTA